MNFEALVKQQVVLGKEIQQVISNFKKDSVHRKTNKAYFEERLQRLTTPYAEFNKIDDSIRQLPNLPLEHEYFAKDYFTEITNIFEQYSGIFQKEIEKFSYSQSSVNNIDAFTSTETVQKLSRRQQALKEATRRSIANICDAESPSYYTLKIKSLERSWQQIEAIHLEIWEMCEDPIQLGYNINDYIALEAETQQALATLTSQIQQQEINHRSTSAPQISSSQHSLPLPKVSIPTFNGDYLKWTQFHDMFTQIVDNQDVPQVQKMWHLKASLSGEAERIIRHLPLSEANYTTAWTLIKSRFDNKRVLVSSLVQRLLDQQNNISSSGAIKGLYDTIQECLHALNNLNVETNSWGPLLIPILVPKLDNKTRMMYEQSLANPREVLTIPEFLEFLKLRFQTLEAAGIKDSQKASQKSLTSTVVPASSQLCKFCNTSSHSIYSCEQFLRISVQDRIKAIQKIKACLNCLRIGHQANKCSSRSCIKCNKRHNTLLHIDNLQPQSGLINKQETSINKRTTAATTNGSLAASTAHSSLYSTTLPSNGYVMLGTIQIQIHDVNGKILQCRALVDSGSQINLMTEKLAKQLELIPEPIPIMIEGIGSNKKRSTYSVTTTIQSRFNAFSTAIRAFVLPKIVSNQPTRHLDISNWKIPENLNLADPRFNHPASIDLLIGAEFHHVILSSGQIQLGNNLPILQNTVFGWMSAGKVYDYSHDSVSCALGSETEDELNNIVKRFWELDTFTGSETHLTEEEQKCEALFAQHTKRNKDGRFVVTIPFKENPEVLGDSIRLAISRFYALERRLIKQPDTKTMYIDFMREYEKLNHMEEIDLEKISSPYYVIPHHCVIRPESSTTKLRVVFDASAKTSTGISLNDIMYSGPVIQSDLQSILTRFRVHRFVFTTDVEKMYRQLLVHFENQKFQIIVWREDPSQQLKFYKLKTVTYGTRSAPYLATKCLQILARDFKKICPLGSRVLERDFYVDDGLTGADSLKDAIELKHQLIQILSTAGLKLRKWCANHSKLLEGITIQDQEVDLDFLDKSSQKAIKTLGLIWLPTSDEFSIKTQQIIHEISTKRTVMSDLARIYDPLGLVAPVVVKAKIFVQQLWQLKLGWDDPLPEDLQRRWSMFCEELKALQKLKIPRHLTNHRTPRQLQLHVFTDASLRAYGAAAYLRAVCDDGTITVQLISSKSRVAPTQTHTIPRLELCAAVLGAQLITKVKADLLYRDIPMWLWTDSEIVLYWINSESTTFQMFIAHRISKIQELTLVQQWRHVSTNNNPADYLTRGVRPTEIKDCTPWFYGPIFLHGNESNWPPEFCREASVPDEKHLELKRVAAALMASHDSNLVDMIYKINHHNSFKTLLRIVAYILRLVKRLQKQQKHSSEIISCGELDDALIIIIRAVQLSEFEEEIKTLKKSNEVKAGSVLCGLTPFIDTNGLIRVGGRITSANLSFDAKHPILLPYNDSITKLIMQQRHEEGLHCAAQALLSQVRQNYWPIKGKLMARSIVNHCIRCRRVKPKMFQQLMGNLPSKRLKPERPFFNSGVDFFGPMWIHYKIRGKRPCKAYIAVFCCFVTKAIHMEVVSDLTTESFIGALQRFISRRGYCQNLYCDNATNFVGAKNQLNELSDSIFKESSKNSIVQFCANKKIAFHFSPPRAPHFGGLWEAAVKSAKYLMIRTMGNASLTYEELETVVVQAEAILNSRPLTPLSSSPNDLTALTPGHFLIGEPITSYPHNETNTGKTPMTTRWKLVNQLKNEFWSRWSKEYLHELQYRYKWKSPSTNVEVGTLVIIKEDNRPTLHWPLGRIIKLYKGEDGLVRVVDIKTATGVLKRPIHNLAPLLPDKGQQSPLNNQESQHQEPIDSTTNENQPPTTKRRKLMVPTSLICMALLCLIPIAFGNQITVTKFSSNPGIHFENIGSAYVSSTHWTLAIYYNLKPYKMEIKTFINGTFVLKRICERLRQENGCHELVSQLLQTRDELEQEDSLLWKHRVKRGAINIIGNVANSLFGVLDSEYAEKMQHTIKNLQNNDNYIVDLLKNQTSVVDSTINLIKTDQSNIQQRFEWFDKKLAEIAHQVVLSRKEDVQQKNSQLLTFLSTQLVMMSARLQKIQLAIINVLTDVHHGKISPLLLSPSQLSDEITKIKNHLPSTLQLPGQQEDLLSMYKLMEAYGGLSSEYVLFQIKIPLVGPDQFNLFGVYPIPMRINNNTMVAVRASTKNLAITHYGDKYFPITLEQMNHCKIMGEHQYLCANPEAIYNEGSKVCHCEISLFNNESKPSCEMQKLKDDTWTQLKNKSQWIFAVLKPSKLIAVCGNDHRQLLLEGSGLLTIKSDCIVKHNSFTIQGQNKITSSTKISYTSFGSLSKVAEEEQVKILLKEEHIEPYNSQLQELSALQETLRKQSYIQASDDKSSQQHQLIIIYGTLILVLCILIAHGIKVVYKKQKKVHKSIPEQKTQEIQETDFNVQV